MLIKSEGKLVMRVFSIAQNILDKRGLNTNKGNEPSFDGSVSYRSFIQNVKATGLNEENCRKIDDLLKGKFQELADKLHINININSYVLGGQADVMIQAIRTLSLSTMRDKPRIIDYAAIQKPSLIRNFLKIFELYPDTKVVKMENLYEYLESKLPEIEEEFSKPQNAK